MKKSAERKRGTCKTVLAKLLQRPKWGHTAAPIGVDTCCDTPTRNDNAIRIDKLATNKSLARRRGTRGFHQIQGAPSPKRNVPRPLGTVFTRGKEHLQTWVSAAVINLPSSNYHYDQCYWNSSCSLQRPSSNVSNTIVASPSTSTQVEEKKDNG